MINRKQSLLCMAWLAAAIGGTHSALGQDFPSKPITMYVPTVGSGADVLGRAYAAHLSNSLGKQVLIVNRGGAGGVLAAETVAKAAPDGHSLLLYGPPIWLLPLLRSNLPYDPVKDFAPVSAVASFPTVVVVHPSSPIKTVAELISVARSKPGQLNSGSDTASSAHLAFELFQSMAGIKITRVPYKGVGPAVTALLSNEVDVVFPVMTVASAHIKSGRLRALAVASAKPSPLTPGLPTVSESGLPGYESVAWTVLLAPASTPAPIINRLNQEFDRLLKLQEIRDFMANAGAEPIGSTPEALALLIRNEISKRGKIIKEAGIKEN